jgi:hypothetical protein
MTPELLLTGHDSELPLPVPAHIHVEPLIPVAVPAEQVPTVAPHCPLTGVLVAPCSA